MGAGEALLGGFAYFFSVWQLCYLQFSPFVLAFLVGIQLPTGHPHGRPGVAGATLLPCLGYTIGFCLVYPLLVASGLSLSRPLIAHIDTLRITSGAVILVIGAYLLQRGRWPLLAGAQRPAALAAMSLLLGLGVAFVYSPCITPMLSAIMGIGSQRATAALGWWLALSYGLGSSIAICTVAVALILAMREREVVARHAAVIRTVCGVFVLALALLNLTGLMTWYKAFALGFAL